MNKRFFFAAVLVAIASITFGVVAANKQLAPSAPKNASVAQLLALSLPDSKGQIQKLAQWQGKFLLVNFWATWCGPCVQEMPELSALQKDLASANVQLLGLGIDSPTNIADFAKKYQITYPLFAAGMEGTELSRQLGNQAGGLPFTVLIAPDGSVAKQYLGRLKMDELRADISKLTKAAK
ncbi:TlpA family protein disulfide reductase [Undibacterium sp. Rencai35W]|uniref:TlpA family protein disulfide reductase n=1 Tax=Undibacterium sp. Rencai35W TaxID=3413046 RepID=UPI003BF0551D